MPIPKPSALSIRLKEETDKHGKKKDLFSTLMCDKQDLLCWRRRCGVGPLPGSPPSKKKPAGSHSEQR